MRIFLEVCRTMNVTRAAENLYMTQPAVSRSIREMEKHYGVRLFERLNQRLYVTESGRRMHAYRQPSPTPARSRTCFWITGWISR